VDEEGDKWYEEDSEDAEGEDEDEGDSEDAEGEGAAFVFLLEEQEEQEATAKGKVGAAGGTATGGGAKGKGKEKAVGKKKRKALARARKFNFPLAGEKQHQTSKCPFTSKYNGVTSQLPRRKWKATTTEDDGKRCHIGYFDGDGDGEENAARAFDSAVRQYLNQPTAAAVLRESLFPVQVGASSSSSLSTPRSIFG
jgi:hypothetical protein